MLTQEKLKSVINYNPETGLFTWLHRNDVQKSANSRWLGKIANSHNEHGYILICISFVKYRAHRLAWLYMTGEWPKNQIDHINGIRDDNRWTNLRSATNTENSQNHRNPSKNNTTGLLGVTYNKERKKYQSKIEVSRKTIHLGRFSCKYAAHEAYLKAKRRLHSHGTI